MRHFVLVASREETKTLRYMEQGAATLTYIVGVLVCSICIIPLWVLFTEKHDRTERISEVDISNGPPR